MGIESVSSQLSLQSTVPSRTDATTAQFKDNLAVRERQDATKSLGTSAARSQQSQTRDYQTSDKLFAQAQTTKDTLTDTRGGGKRGSVLDISV